MLEGWVSKATPEESSCSAQGPNSINSKCLRAALTSHPRRVGDNSTEDESYCVLIQETNHRGSRTHVRSHTPVHERDGIASVTMPTSVGGPIGCDCEDGHTH